MAIHGFNFIGSTLSSIGDQTYTAFSPTSAEPIGARFHVATPEEVDRAVRLADSAFGAYRALPRERRAAFLDAIADEITALGDELLEQAHVETALPLPRLVGERARTTGQLKAFAELIREGSWVQARINVAMPDRKPLPRVDLRRMLIPLGPVGVFGASNFPFAFSVAGGDTSSALAAGCPVIVKAHPAHPAVSEMTACAVLRAAAATGMPDGVFSMVHGATEVGMSLVNHPLLQAVGFTGSLRGGRALFNAAAARPRPIPVYAEMGSINPAFMLPGALAARSEQLIAGLSNSITLGVGQFCTNPGLVVGIGGHELEQLRAGVASAISATPPATMLHPGIAKAYVAGVARLSATDGVLVAGKAESSDAPTNASAVLFSTDAASFLRDHTLSEENFGPSSLMVACGSPDELEQIARTLEGQLTASVHGTEEDFEKYHSLVSVLETRVGRLIFNGYPTGVEVCSSMQHGGPYPATTDSRTTSVGTAAIERFTRPICYQDTPQTLLPVELRDENPAGIWRLVEGNLTKDAIV
jgi:NADP-dependent aldehyde dehydrogenase